MFYLKRFVCCFWLSYLLVVKHKQFLGELNLNMDDLIRNLKSKLSVDNLVQMMKDAKVIDNNRIKEEDVRKTLETIDTNNLIDVDELALKLNEITEQSKKSSEEKPKNMLLEKAKASFGVFNKTVEKEKEPHEVLQDNFTGFLD